MTKNTQMAYMRGFRKAAEELGVDYRELYKYAQPLGWVANKAFSGGAGRMSMRALVNTLGKTRAQRAMYFMPILANKPRSPFPLQKALEDLNEAKLI